MSIMTATIFEIMLFMIAIITPLIHCRADNEWLLYKIKSIINLLIWKK